jgi:hypothetical protein
MTASPSDPEPSKKQIRSRALLAACVHAGFSFVLFHDPEDGGDMFF